MARRQRMRPKASRKAFRRGIKRFHPRNRTSHYQRGGIRL